jgi:peroxiredoxin
MTAPVRVGWTVLLLATVSCGPPGGGQGAVEPGGDGGGSGEMVPPPDLDLSGLPDFTLERHDGTGTVNMHSLAGRHVIAMSFWATWCDACQIELPQLETLYKKYRKDGLVVLAITMDTAETVPEVPAAVQRLGLTFPVLLDTESQVTGVYNPRNAAPLFILIDQHGKQVYSHEGFVIADVEEMEKEILEALGKK